MMKDPVLDFVRTAALKETEIEAVRLFGSRARGDHHERSDYDLAVYAPHWSVEEWSKWSENLREAVPTLAGLDLVRITDETSASLLKAIEKDGIFIFKRALLNLERSLSTPVTEPR